MPPHPMRAAAGAALCALLTASLLGIGRLGVWAVSSVGRGLDSLAAGVGQQLAELRASPEPSQTRPPSPDTGHVSVAEPLPQESAGVSEKARVPAEVPSEPRGVSVREKTPPEYLPFREGRKASLADAVRQADYAVIQTLARLGMARSRANPLLSARYQAPSGEDYFFQRIRIYAGGTAEEFVRTLREMLDVWAEQSTVRLDGDGVIRLAVDGHPTHELFFSSVGTVFVPPPAPGRPRLTIVIDDMGNGLEQVRELLDLDIPITFSIMPRAPHAAETAEAAHAAGQEVLIHQPMEPRQAPYVSAGTDALLTAMEPNEIRRVLRNNIGRVPHAVGMNNHMGSRLTADAAACRLVAREASAAGLFILDSLTHPDSVLQVEAAGIGAEALRRDVFLDDGPAVRAVVLRNLRHAEQVARERGQAVAIGHPRPETLAALKAWVHERDVAVAVVPLRYQSALQPPDARNNR